MANFTVDRGGNRASSVRKALDALVEHFPTMLDSAGFNPDSCVLATRVACLAFTEVGIPASPLACRLDILNAPYVRAIADGWKGQPWDGGEPLDEEHERHVIESGAWSVILGDPRNEGVPRPNGSRGFNAHLCTLVERKWLLDLTLHQASRPAKGIVLDTHYVDVDSAFVRGAVPIVVGNEDGCLARYQVVQRNDFLNAPDWLRVRRDERLVRASVDRIREALR